MTIKINTIDDLELPIMQPLIIPTKDLPWYSALWVWMTVKRRFRIKEDYYFKMTWLPGEPVIKIHKNFIFDGASIPRLLWWILSPTGLLFVPAIFHDFGYTFNAWVMMDDKLYEPAKGQKFFDDQFKNFSELLNGVPLVSSSAWASLRTFGKIAWAKKRLLDFILPEMIQNVNE